MPENQVKTYLLILIIKHERDWSKSQSLFALSSYFADQSIFRVRFAKRDYNTLEGNSSLNFNLIGNSKTTMVSTRPSI